MNLLKITPRVAPVHRPLRLLTMAAMVACVSLACATAFAQGDKQSKGATNDASSLDQKLDSYWSVDRHLPSVKDRLYTRAGRFGLGVYAGLLSSQPFYYYYPVGLRASYYFNNYWGVEVEGAYMDAPGVLSHDTELTSYLKSALKEGYSDATTEDRFLWRGSAVVVWHPLYGKLAFLQRKLAHFDFNLTAGLGAVSVQRPNDTRERTTSEVAPELVLGGGIQFFATEHVIVRLEGRAYVYQGADTPVNYDEGGSGIPPTWSDRLQVPAEFLLGASYLF